MEEIIIQIGVLELELQGLENSVDDFERKNKAKRTFWLY